jgi:hypothetical protein
LVSLLIVFIAAFSTLKVARQFFLPFLTISFVAMVITTFGLVEEATMDGTENVVQWLRLFGFFRYPHDFMFAMLGFSIVCMLGQIGPHSALRRALRRHR